MLCNLEVLAADGAQVDLRFNWHTLSHRYKTTDSYFGTSFYRLDIGAEQPLITRKKVVLKNDYIHQVIDIYHI
jgi:benzoate/toluate 1,2-dioxygenase beta subunit